MERIREAASHALGLDRHEPEQGREQQDYSQEVRSRRQQEGPETPTWADQAQRRKEHTQEDLTSQEQDRVRQFRDSSYDSAQAKKEEAQAQREGKDVKYEPALKMPEPQKDGNQKPQKDANQDNKPHEEKGLLEKVKEVLPFTHKREEKSDDKGLIERMKERLHEVEESVSAPKDSGVEQESSGERKTRQRFSIRDIRWLPDEDEGPIGGPDIEEVDVHVPVGGLLTSITNSARDLYLGGGKGLTRSVLGFDRDQLGHESSENRSAYNTADEARQKFVGLPHVPEGEHKEPTEGDLARKEAKKVGEARARPWSHDVDLHRAQAAVASEQKDLDESSAGKGSRQADLHDVTRSPTGLPRDRQRQPYTSSFGDHSDKTDGPKPADVSKAFDRAGRGDSADKGDKYDVSQPQQLHGGKEGSLKVGTRKSFDQVGYSPKADQKTMGSGDASSIGKLPKGYDATFLEKSTPSLAENVAGATDKVKGIVGGKG